jgi:glyoxylase-like metal-dependent hydrolase (beta-lactamase superfamily II)
MNEIVPGLYWIPLPMIISEASNLTFVNAYVIKGKDGYLLVDAGWNTPESFAALEKGMAEIGAAVKDISQIVITHVHPDHYGMAGHVKNVSGARLVMHHLEKEFIVPRYISMESLINEIDQLLLANGVPQKMINSLSQATVGLEQYVVATPPDATLHDGEMINTGLFTLKVLWGPGHSSGHICLYEPEKKIMISGDHILPTITPNVSVHPQAIENPLGRYFDSLNELKHLDVKIALPGHEKPFTDFENRVETILHHHEQRNEEIIKALGNKSGTSFQIAQEVIWGLKGTWQSLPAFHKRIAILETLAHLEMMASRGQVDRLPGEDIMLFRTASPRR